jgi:ribosomal protein S18 acetylase RimI-like enzyme
MNDDYAKLIGEGRVTVADEGGSLVGVLVMSPGEGGLLLENIAVLPARQARGLGAELIAHAEAEAYRRGFSFIWLYTHEKMTENLAWYARLGYVEFDRRTEHGFSRVFLRKSLR